MLTWPLRTSWTFFRRSNFRNNGTQQFHLSACRVQSLSLGNHRRGIRESTTKPAVSSAIISWLRDGDLKPGRPHGSTAGGPKHDVQQPLCTIPRHGYFSGRRPGREYGIPTIKNVDHVSMCCQRRSTVRLVGLCWANAPGLGNRLEVDRGSSYYQAATVDIPALKPPPVARRQRRANAAYFRFATN